MKATIETRARRGRDSRLWGRLWPIYGLSHDTRPHRMWRQGHKLDPTRYQGSVRIYEVERDGDAVAWRTDDDVFYAFEGEELVEFTAEQLLERLRPTPGDIWAEVRSRVQEGDHVAARRVARWVDYLERNEGESRGAFSERVKGLYTDMVTAIGEATRHTIEVVPRLEGTPRQVAWANTIRADMVDWIVNVRGVLDVAVDECDWSGREVGDVADHWMLFWGVEVVLRRLEGVLEAETSARRFIAAQPGDWKRLTDWKSSRAPARLLDGSFVSVQDLVRAWVATSQDT